MPTEINQRRARQAIQHIRAERERGRGWAEIHKICFPNNELGITRIRELVRRGHCEGAQPRTVDALARAWLQVQRSVCQPCTFYAALGHRILGDTYEACEAILLASYLGEYWSIQRTSIQRAARNVDNCSEEELEHGFTVNKVTISECENCARPIFKVWRSDSDVRQGALFHMPDRIHIIVADGNYMPHVVVRPVDDVSSRPLSGIALFDEADRGPSITATRIAFVRKTGSMGVDDRPPLSILNELLVNDTPNIDGVLTGWNTRSLKKTTAT